MSDSDAILREPWPNVARQRDGAAFGMWLFLATEVLFFGALFLTYAIYRTLYPAEFRAAIAETNLFYGTLNTIVLLTSSLVMTVAVRSADLGLRRAALACLAITAALGLAFVVIKGLEYGDDLDKHLWPGNDFRLKDLPAAQLFFALYWVMTGVHAIHLAIGIGLTVVLAVSLARHRLALRSPAVETVSLYWHFVDTIWIVLYTLLYLPGRL